MTDHLHWALEYAHRGWRVMPTHWMALDENFDRACSCGQEACGSPGKHPRPRRGSRDATTSEVQVASWWQHIWPRANIGIATGQPSGIYVIDLDGEDAIAEWAVLEMIHGDAPTLTCETGGGGRHLYYRLPPRVSLPNTAKRIAPTIDTRGEGGYVLAPPSNHRSGRDYRWREWPADVAPLPGWVKRLLAAPQAQGRGRAPRPIRAAQEDDPVAMRVLTEEAEKVMGTPPGGRNDQLFRSAASVLELVAGGDLTLGSAMAAMEEAGLASGLTESEVKATIRSAGDAARETPRRIRTRQLEGGTA